MASLAVTRPDAFFLINIELRRNARRVSKWSFGWRRRRLAYFVSCLFVSFSIAAAMSDAVKVRDARAMDISVRWAAIGVGMSEVGRLFRGDGCWALKSLLRRAAVRALASLVMWDLRQASRLEPDQWPAGSGLAAIRTDFLGGGSCVGDGRRIVGFGGMGGLQERLGDDGCGGEDDTGGVVDGSERAVGSSDGEKDGG